MIKKVKKTPSLETTDRIIREARPDDAKDFLSYLKTVGGESDNLTFGVEGVAMEVELEAHHLEEMMLSPNSLQLLALEDDKIIGSLTFIAGKRERIAHAGEMAISVLQEHWGQGVGSALIVAFLTWIGSAGTGIRKVNLLVREDNERAINLYKRYGFVNEGRRSRMFLLDGQFVHGIHMGLEIDGGTT
ncbi:GNAT family N-acetyltransferase [Parasphaerochaeta coccoides]|uniref:GCN5-related N-acetyltransferase n=1 Tax=Parasphaerochaeta coccoides (strain ATCC BAA-1237 / DSM 17374 / SPN1) TaxID=760011 RepID=F4GHW2_PARC1|nr:GNAT family N-acetyltransferase [Parasphaerochaeta coccoides]AEC02075.1 GCN5-related N-acetyltransferase [Parasphaerochaeta coccoides DSM 17374]